MSRLLTVLIAGLAAVALNANAADQKDPQAKDNQTQSQPNATKGKPEQRDSQAGATTQQPDQGGTSGTNNQTSQQGRNDGPAGSSDNTQHNQTPNQANKAGADEGNMGRNPNQPGGEVSAKEKEYLADMEKCNAMSGDKKTQCVSSAKKRAGQM